LLVRTVVRGARRGGWALGATLRSRGGIRQILGRRSLDLTTKGGGSNGRRRLVGVTLRVLVRFHRERRGGSKVAGCA